MFSVQTTLDEFENGGLTLKMHQIFPIHTSTKKFESERNNHRSFWICISGKLGREITYMSLSQRRLSHKPLISKLPSNL